MAQISLLGVFENLDKFKHKIHSKMKCDITHPPYPSYRPSDNAKHLRHRYLDRHFMTMLMAAHSWE